MPDNAWIFEQATRLATAVQHTFGQCCEAVVHDFSNLDSSLIFMAGNVTGRTTGAPITDMVLKELRRDGDGVRDTHGYRTTSRDGRVLKSSSIYLRDDLGRVIGCMCINVDITGFLNTLSLLEELTTIEKIQEDERSETFATSVVETVGSMVEEAIASRGKQAPDMSKQEKVQLVEHLERQGVFLIKGSVGEVASYLGVSKFTVYNYLQEVRNNAAA